MFNTPEGCQDIWNVKESICPECGGNMYLDDDYVTVLSCSECNYTQDTELD